jgi:hypothetical protein
MKTDLYTDPAEGTSIVFDGIDTVKVVVAHAPFSKLTMALDLDDIDRLLAVVDHAVDPEPDLAEFFSDVYACQTRPARLAAAAFVIAAPGLTEILR